MMLRWMTVAMLIGLTAAPAMAGQSVSVRLVHATNKGGSGAGLEDVAGMLKRSLPYSAYRLVAAASLPVPANNASTTLSGYTVSCNGQQSRLAITVSRGRQQLVNTTVSLRDGKPFILGGLPSSEGKLILVFVAR